MFWERLMGIDIHEASFLGHKGLSVNVNNIWITRTDYMDALEQAAHLQKQTISCQQKDKCLDD